MSNYETDVKNFLSHNNIINRFINKNTDTSTRILSILNEFHLAYGANSQYLIINPILFRDIRAYNFISNNNKIIKSKITNKESLNQLLNCINFINYNVEDINKLKILSKEECITNPEIHNKVKNLTDKVKNLDHIYELINKIDINAKFKTYNTILDQHRIFIKILADMIEDKFNSSKSFDKIEIENKMSIIRQTFDYHMRCCFGPSLITQQTGIPRINSGYYIDPYPLYNEEDTILSLDVSEDISLDDNIFKDSIKHIYNKSLIREIEVTKLIYDDTNILKYIQCKFLDPIYKENYISKIKIILDDPSKIYIHVNELSITSNEIISGLLPYNTLLIRYNYIEYLDTDTDFYKPKFLNIIILKKSNKSINSFNENIFNTYFGEQQSKLFLKPETILNLQVDVENLLNKDEVEIEDNNLFMFEEDFNIEIEEDKENLIYDKPADDDFNYLDSVLNGYDNDNNINDFLEYEYEYEAL